MYKYNFLSLTLLLALSAGPALAASQDQDSTKALQSMTSAPEAAPNNSAQVDPENDSLAGEAGKDFSDGAKGLGRGFVKGAKVTGNAFKKAGVTMGRGFKRAGTAIRDYFAGKPEVEERDLSEDSETEALPSTPRDSSAEDLDAVGNDVPKVAPKRLSKEETKTNTPL
ncbi:MAG TPA: hypothetical protein VJR29_02925 [bacterium]|nr:hypothetical protein [bacterium]